MNLRRISLSGLFVLALVACGNKQEAAPSPAPDKAEAKPVSAEAAKPAKAVEPGADTGKAQDPAAAKADEGNGAADGAKAKSDSAAAKIDIPDPANGILPPGAADKILKVGSRPVVRLLDGGAEPREPTSYALTKGPAKPFTVAMDMSMSMKAAGMNLPATTLPRMVMLFQMSAGDRTDKGEWPVEGTLAKVSVETKAGDPMQDKIAAALKPQLENIKGIGMSYFVTEKGYAHDVKTTVPPTLPAAAQQMLQGMNQSLESMTAPLPNEPVGKGAKWQVVTRVTTNGTDLLQVSTFTLKDRAGSTLNLDVTVKQLAAKEDINPPNMPPGTSAKLRSFNSGGTGATALDTKDIAPTGGNMSIKSAMALEVQAGAAAGGAQQTSVETTVGLTFARPSK